MQAVLTISVGQPDSPLSTTPGQNFSAVPCPHALHEAMLFAALTLFRLIGTKHVYTPQYGLLTSL